VVVHHEITGHDHRRPAPARMALNEYGRML
jgi:hypothetical protein